MYVVADRIESLGSVVSEAAFGLLAILEEVGVRQLGDADHPDSVARCGRLDTGHRNRPDPHSSLSG